MTDSLDEINSLRRQLEESKREIVILRNVIDTRAGKPMTSGHLSARKIIKEIEAEIVKMDGVGPLTMEHHR